MTPQEIATSIVVAVAIIAVFLWLTDTSKYED